MSKYIYFGASWCGPCKQVKPMVIQSSKNIQIVDVDNNAELSMKYGIRSVPTLVEVNDTGDAINRYTGSPAIMAVVKE